MGARARNVGTYVVLVYALTAVTLVLLRANRPGAAFISSAGAVSSVILTAGFSLFPFLMPSKTDPASSLTVWDASSSQMTLEIMLIATVIFMPLILAYTAWVFRVLRGRITLEHMRQQPDTY